MPHTALLLWAGATLVPAAIRWRLRSAYLRSADSGAETERWLRSFLVLAALQSALLGSAAWFVFPQTDVIAQTALIVILSGVASGGVLALLGHWPTAITHIAFVIVPLAVKFFFVPAFPVSFAPLAVVFGIVLAVVARDFSNMLVRSLRSQLEKERLIEDLSAAKREAEMANQEKMAQSAKVAEQRLQAAVDRETARSAAFLQTVLENTTEALVAFGEDGRLSLMNKQLHQITGLPANLCRVGASIGDVIRFLIEGSDVGDTEDGVNRVIDLTHPRHLRFFEYRSPGGRDIEVRMSPMPDGGVVATLVDVTERKRAERDMTQLQKMESPGNFVGGMAHNLNNLLLPIISLSRRTMNALPEGDQRQYLERVVQAGERAKNLVSQVVGFSREEEVGVDVIDIAEAIRSSMALVHSTLPSTIKVKESLSESVGLVLGDPAQTATVLMNLVSNAIDAMAGGVGELSVSLSRIEIGGDGHDKPSPGPPLGSYARLSVTDTGSGMDEATINRIFDPFFTTKDVGEGTGLGLSTAYATVSRQGGTIRVASEPGTGTTFHVYFPLVQIEADRPASAP